MDHDSCFVCACDMLPEGWHRPMLGELRSSVCYEFYLDVWRSTLSLSQAWFPFVPTIAGRSRRCACADVIQPLSVRFKWGGLE